MKLLMPVVLRAIARQRAFATGVQFIGLVAGDFDAVLESA